MTYGVSLWAAPFAIRTFHLDARSVGFAIGIPGAIGAGVGVILGGRLSDAWKSRDPRGRLFVCMIAAVAPVPLLVAQYYASTFATYVILSAFVYGFANMWVGSAVAAYQDFVLPRMYGTVSATYLIGSTMIGLAIGPYASGKVATVTGDLRAGVFSLFVFPPITLLCLWIVSRRMQALESSRDARARDAGERLESTLGAAAGAVA
jgi:MFS family permease